MGVNAFPMNLGGRSAPDWLAFLNLLNDGSDGAFNPVSNQTLTSDVYRYSSMYIPAGVTISPSSNYLIILVNGTAQIDGLITSSGKGALGAVANAGTTGTGAGGDGTSSTTYGLGAGGGTGGHTGAAVGGVGGSTQAGTVAGGTSGNGTPSAGGAGGNSPKHFPASINLFDLNILRQLNGAGGAKGGYASISTGVTAGSGGNGGGSIIVVAKNIVGTGAIRSDGLAGANANLNGAGPNCCAVGGGGGGGGFVAAAASYIAPTIAVTANGGAAGTSAQNGYIAGASGAGGNGIAWKMINLG